MNDSVLRTLLEWLRPRANWHWLILGSANPDAPRTILQVGGASQITVIVEKEAVAETLRAGICDERVTVRVEEYAALGVVSSPIDVTLMLGVLEHAADPLRVVLSVARVTRLNGLVVATENNSVTRRALWNWWLDARLNDVSTREFENFSMVRGTR